MASATFNLTGSLVLERGAAYSWSFNLDTASGEYNVSGYQVSGYIFRKWDKAYETNWTAEIISASSGIVNMSLTAEQTAALSLAPLEHQIYIIPPDTGTIRILKGDIVPDGGLNIF